MSNPNTTSTCNRIFNPPGFPSLASTYSHVSIVPISPTKRLISFAGQTGTTVDDEANRKLSLGEQTRIALERVDFLLNHVGASKKDIVMVRQYVVGLTDLSAEDDAAKNETYLRWWASTEGNDALLPPDTLIGVHSLFSKGTRIEFEMQVIADIPE